MIRHPFLLVLLLAGSESASGAGSAAGIRLTEGDLNDFLSPASECVLPLQAMFSKEKPPPGSVAAPIRPQEKPRKKKIRKVRKVETNSSAATVSAQNPTSLPENQPRLREKSKSSDDMQGDAKKRSQVVASVTLSDCLSCSGCVTSAEEVMMKRQGMEHLTAAVEVGSTCVVSFSPQSLSSLAAVFSTTASAFARSVSSFLKLRVGVKFVFDTSLSVQIAQHEARCEFMERWERKGNFPILCTECPGFVIFTEKKEYDLLSPFLSTVRSPQAISGKLIKQVLSSKIRDGNEKQVWHCAIMPCFDKKLESSRNEFSFVDKRAESAGSVPETDAVITTSELHSFLSKEGFRVQDWIDGPGMDSLRDLLTTSLCSAKNEKAKEVGGVRYDQTEKLEGEHSSENLRQLGGNLMLPSLFERHLPQHSAGYSNGYLEVVARHAAKQILNVDLPPSLVYSFPARDSQDLKELKVRDEKGRELNFAAVYGYRHLQTLMLKIRKGQCDYHYVEVMSCPEGCNNGGGQLNTKSKDEVNQRYVEYVSGFSSKPLPQEVLNELEHQREGDAMEVGEAPGESRGGTGSEWNFRTGFTKREESITAVLENW